MKINQPQNDSDIVINNTVNKSNVVEQIQQDRIVGVFNIKKKPIIAQI